MFIHWLRCAVFERFEIVTRKPSYIQARYTRPDGAELSMVVFKLMNEVVFETAIILENGLIHDSIVRHDSYRDMIQYQKQFKYNLISINHGGYYSGY